MGAFLTGVRKVIGWGNIAFRSSGVLRVEQRKRENWECFIWMRLVCVCVCVCAEEAHASMLPRLESGFHGRLCVRSPHVSQLFVPQERGCYFYMHEASSI